MGRTGWGRFTSSLICNGRMSRSSTISSAPIGAVISALFAGVGLLGRRTIPGQPGKRCGSARLQLHQCILPTLHGACVEALFWVPPWDGRHAMPNPEPPRPTAAPLPFSSYISHPLLAGTSRFEASLDRHDTGDTATNDYGLLWDLTWKAPYLKRLRYGRRTQDLRRRRQ